MKKTSVLDKEIYLTQIFSLIYKAKKVILVCMIFFSFLIFRKTNDKVYIYTTNLEFKYDYNYPILENLKDSFTLFYNLFSSKEFSSLLVKKVFDIIPEMSKSNIYENVLQNQLQYNNYSMIYIDYDPIKNVFIFKFRSNIKEIDDSKISEVIGCVNILINSFNKLLSPGYLNYNKEMFNISQSKNFLEQEILNSLIDLKDVNNLLVQLIKKNDTKSSYFNNNDILNKKLGIENIFSFRNNYTESDEVLTALILTIYKNIIILDDIIKLQKNNLKNIITVKEEKKYLENKFFEIKSKIDLLKTKMQTKNDILNINISRYSQYKFLPLLEEKDKNIVYEMDYSKDLVTNFLSFIILSVFFGVLFYNIFSFNRLKKYKIISMFL